MRQTITSLLTVCMFCGTALAQTEVERFDRQLQTIERNQRLMVNLNVPPEQRTYFDYGGFTTIGYLSLVDPNLNNVGMWQYDLGAYAHLIYDGSNEFFFRGRLFHREFTPGDRFSSDGENIDGRIDRLFYRFDLQRYQAAYYGKQSNDDVAIKIGRDLTLWGNGLVLSNDLDAVTIDVSHDALSLEAIAGVTPLDTVDFDASRPRFDSHTKRGFYGAMGSMRVGEQRPYIYGLVQRDYNSGDNLTTDDTISDQPVVADTRFNYNSYYIGVGSTGELTDRLSYGVEAAFEGGHTLSSSFTLDNTDHAVANTQTSDRIEAFAMDARLDYVLPDTHFTRFSAEAIIASGDDDRVSSATDTYGGAAPNTTDHAFNAFGLLDVGTAFSPAVSNLAVLRLGASTYPFTQVRSLKHMQVGTDLYWFSKLDDTGPIDEATTHHSFLGVEPDLYMNWQITSDITLTTRYGLFVPGGAIVADRLRQFVYTGVTVAF